ncbi:DEAD/DEAH box helicase [Anaerocolumna cellulosilytica]|uniref:DEAD/DEAH box helicase n=1 Tax=Anaerocolumna cellulosilytica TaxID=433286 RepID=A0A6S6R3U1_9FIRM|nr:DEAD/DEAH box helicase [Anaerocolumna cellulosilytica]MBB5197233.1 ATP-dependent Lhr-like helicase [Anaerocolumna cellulosilytica]BCJ94040.1 DEAD/DEAH box helicase [Anaerocolumna cellulosilytica]
MASKELSIFSKYTIDWFTQSLGEPTAVQKDAWPAIAKGGDTLVSAPTGTGKTLSSFLVFIDRLMAMSREGNLKQELQLIYVSPLKALAGDIRENLRRPLDGILCEQQKSKPHNTEVKGLDIAIRTGDTTQKERRQMIKTPPHILITTPESLYLLLTSKSGQTILQTAKYIIIDELHALIDSKRGAHLMLSIARLDKLCEKPLQRIGLSATIEPLSQAAQYLSPENVTIVAPKMEKEIQFLITSSMAEEKKLRKDPVWQEIAETIFSFCKDSKSVIAFVEGRAYAEKLAYYVNQLGGEGFARTHHGSLSKEHRFEVEQALREGKLRLLCATSSMELGIDVGDIDQVFQIGCPRTISSTMQRLGRAGHNPGRVSIMHMFPRAAAEGLYCGMTAEVARNGGVEYSRPPKLCLDVLAQHLVSMAVTKSYSVDEVVKLLSRAYPFLEVSKEDIHEVLCMLSGDFEHEQDIPVRPRLLYDRIRELVEGDNYSRMLAVSTGGTIPDKGLYTVRTDTGVKLGELDEEFVFETRVGDRFLLGTFAWRIASIQKDTVFVTPTATAGARLPFWKGEIKGRSIQTGISFGKILRRLEEAEMLGRLEKELMGLGLDKTVANGAGEYIKRQLGATQGLPSDETIIIEHFRDETGAQMMVHSVFGRQINSPLAILAAETAKEEVNMNINYVEDDDGFLLLPYSEGSIPEGLLYRICPETAKAVLAALLPATPLFNMNFRYNSARALMMGVSKAKRNPLWVQRLRSAEMLDSLVKIERHPLIRETKRECLEDYWDLPGLMQVLHEIQAGTIRVREMYVETPSPMSMKLRQQTEASMMYDYAPTPMGIQAAAAEALKEAKQVVPDLEHLTKVSERTKLPQDARQLHSLLMAEGDLMAGELQVPIEWLEELAVQEKVLYIEPGLWIAAEQKGRYENALIEGEQKAREYIVRQALRYRGAFTSKEIADRYLFTETDTMEILHSLCVQKLVIEREGIYYHGELYNRAAKETIQSRRQVKTLPAENYAAFLAGNIKQAAPPSEQLREGLLKLCGKSYPAALWESVILPSRVQGYRPELLDTLLSQGLLFWKLAEDGGVSFHMYEDMDWEAEVSSVTSSLSEEESTLYEGLLKRGASFMQRLAPLIGGASPYDSLLTLAQKGLVFADSFLPVRQWQLRDKLEKTTTRQRAAARSKAMTTGRWEVLRPLQQLTIEQQLERAFDRSALLCRETAGGINWSEALSVLRVWEYTGRVRRGYFIEGLSGIQFIRDKDYEGVFKHLNQPANQILWLPAIDPFQPYGKIIPHKPDRAFINVAGTIVALQAGMPIAVMERQGKVLRIFEEAFISEVLKEFAKDFERRRLFPGQNRIIVKQYPLEAKRALSEAGFIKEITEYTLYRK